MAADDSEPMMSRTPNEAAPAPAALIAFQRGVERRGAVFAQLQVGDAETGDRAFVAAMRAFRLPAARIPISDWPRQFWTLLLATPELRETPAAPRWGSGFGGLGQLGRGPRAALQLRLVAGLPEADAAAVLGVARPTYRLALQRALPHGEDGRPDAEAWRMLGEASQHALRDLSAERMAHLARMREAAVLGRKLEPSKRAGPPSPARDRSSAPARWRSPALWTIAILTLLALAATFLLPSNQLPAPGNGRVRVTPLPPVEPPQATYDAQTALVTHPDFELLLAERGDAAARDPAFHAWLAAGAPVADGEPLPEAAPFAEAAAAAVASQEGSDAP